MNGVEFLGIIDKPTDLPRFIEAIRSVDLGCQLSRAELAGIAMMEFLRVGVPIIATNIVLESSAELARSIRYPA